MENKINKKIDIKILIILIISFILLSILVLTGKTVEFDNIITEVIHKIIPENIYKILEIITEIGGMRILPIIVLTTFFLLIFLKKEKLAILVILNSTISAASYIVIKNIIQRPRPYPFRFIVENGYSFPSGHTTNNIAFYGLVIYLIWIKLKNKKLKIILTVLLAIWTLTVGITRIYFNVHYPSDVVGGIILGFCCILISTNIIGD